MLQSDRFFNFTGVSNFRHMGGYAAANGRTTRGDLLFRSGHVELKTPKDIEHFEGLGIDTAFDFRTRAERRYRPLQFPVASPPRIVELGVSGGSVGHLMTFLETSASSANDVTARMKLIYTSLVIDSADIFRAFLNHLITTESGVLIICSLGKDRTGIASALLLAALGVPKQGILEDYLLSSRAYRNMAEGIARLEYLLGSKRLFSDKPLIEPVLSAQPEYFDAFWHAVQTAAGGIENFITQYLKIDPSDVRILREKFTE
ncbi:MAG: tyrosine-protein phosphatase [Desulfobacterales bacterium]|jgi:protein-tyrosine phosphatase|nr:tyrosine-protein phosphatase [Desulfobacterales bacterium]